jgi:hypothetical protein
MSVGVCSRTIFQHRVSPVIMFQGTWFLFCRYVANKFSGLRSNEIKIEIGWMDRWIDGYGYGYGYIDR